MNLLPQASGIRPRFACEISPQGVVAARADTAASPLAGVARVLLAAGAVVPSLKPGNIVDRVAVSAAVRKTLEDIGARSNGRGSDLTLIIPDAAVRVLLLDFDALPNRLSEALPIVRFRLKKLLPFDADDAMISYQVMSTSKLIVRVLAVAVPRDVLSEYETIAREAGFEPGAVLPSTLACVASADDSQGAALLVNSHAAGVTTAIVRNGILLLHRSVDLQPSGLGTGGSLVPALSEGRRSRLPLVDADDSAQEWAAQEALPEHGRPAAAQGLQAVHPAVRFANEIAEAVNVAAAYFEDTLAQVPTRILSAGALGAEGLQNILEREGVAQADRLGVRELVQPGELISEAVAASIPRGCLAGVLGGLRG